MRWLITVISVVGVIVVLAVLLDTSPTISNDPAEVKRLEGTWHVVAIVTGGKRMPAAETERLGLRYIFTADKLIIRQPGKDDTTNAITLDASAKLKKMTIHHVPPFYAVYAIAGDQLQLCLMVDPNPKATFPTALASQVSPVTDLLTLERRPR